MNTRRLASVALAAVVVLSTAGCSMISPQATTISYSAAEGVNLQFCSLVVNYDLPWNPQRIEQRIGRFIGVERDELAPFLADQAVGIQYRLPFKNAMQAAAS